MPDDGTASPAEALFVARTMRTLELISFEPLSAPRVAQLLDVHPRTARRLLNRLTDEGYAVRTRDARRLYSPSMRLVALAGQIVHRAALTRLALPFVERLRERTGATAQLVIPSYRAVLCVLRSAGDRETGVVGLGELAPSHCTAGGKALLAFRDAWRESLLSRPLSACTARSITDPAAVRAEAAATVRRGYAVERGEHRETVAGVAAPVFGHDEEAVAALGVSVAEELDLDALAAHVVAVAGELSDALRAAP
jgi:DNA-binding IclR family transcriptional regulator